MVWRFVNPVNLEAREGIINPELHHERDSRIHVGSARLRVADRYCERTVVAPRIGRRSWIQRAPSPHGQLGRYRLEFRCTRRLQSSRGSRPSITAAGSGPRLQLQPVELEYGRPGPIWRARWTYHHLVIELHACT